MQALLCVASTRLGLWIIPFKHSKESFGDTELSNSRASNWDSVREVAEFVKLASKLVPHATCLTQALATRNLLTRIGQASSLKIGVGKDSDDKLIAHAWIEVEGRIIIGKIPEIRRYSVMSRDEGQQLI